MKAEETENQKPQEPKLYNKKTPIIHELKEVDLTGVYSYANYLRWEFDERVELIKGKLVKMSPAPNTNHQEIAGSLYAKFFAYLENKKCRAFIAPFDVRFPYESTKDEDVYTVLQPDICVVCDQRKIEYRGCLGAPDLVVEVLSPGNHAMELKRKFSIYEEFGVREYWIVNPLKRLLLQYVLDDSGKYNTEKVHYGTDTISSAIFTDFYIDLGVVFARLID